MAEITRVAVASLSSVLPPDNVKISGLKAGEAILAGQACYIKASDGKVWLATGAAANAAARVRGFAMNDTPVGEAVTLIWDVNFRYGSGLTVAADYYLSGTVPGGLADAASTGGTAPIAFAIDATRIKILSLK